MGYKDILDKVIWSFSSLHQFEQCPYSFYLKKIDNSEISEGNFYSEAGGYVHEILEMIFSGELNIDNAIDYYMDNYDSHVVYETKQSTMENKYNQAIDFLAMLELDELEDYEILGVEKEVRFEIEGFKFIGFIDLLLKHKKTGRIILVDHKSSGHFLGKNGKPLKAQADNFKAYSHQMYLYCKAVFDEYGVFPDRIVWNHFFEQTITNIPFSNEDYEEALLWSINTIKRIYEDEEFAAIPSYMLCKVLCNYRNSCCYAMEEGDE